jgi:RNA polymerase sigma factor (sigma-70 family)
MAARELSDGELVRRCRRGDAQAWTGLVDRFSRYVYAICSRAYRLSDADAEDVFQEVFARTYEHLGRLRDDTAIRPWIGQLTRRLAVDRLRARSREDVDDEAVFELGAPDERLERVESAIDLHDALAALGEPCTEVLDRFFARDESYRTISAELGLPQGTIASRISRCLSKLRERLEADRSP